MSNIEQMVIVGRLYQGVGLSTGTRVPGYPFSYGYPGSIIRPGHPPIFVQHPPPSNDGPSVNGLTAIKVLGAVL
jgi:hypothetical protein